MTSDAYLPVIVGIGEIVDRLAEVEQARSPVAMMADALREADRNAGAALLPLVDSIDVVDVRCRGYADLPGAVCGPLGIAPARQHHTPIGGDVPVRSLRQMATAIAEGRSRVAAFCGGEAAASVQQAARARQALPWPAADALPRQTAWHEFLHPQAVQLDLVQPLNVYPLYENACRAAWGQTFDEARRESGELLSRLSWLAADNPTAWLREALSADQITLPAPDNRPVTWPYNKRMVANPLVNQASALLMTSLATARQLGIPEHRLVHVWGGTGASELRDFATRDRFDRSTAMETVLRAAWGALDAVNADQRRVDLYSCFPCVPKMARRVLGLSLDEAAGVTGGLPFFGAPLSNYMGHATNAMVRALRSDGGNGLLYGQGEHVTKHQCLVLGMAPAPPSFRMLNEAAANEAAIAARGASPVMLADHRGPARVETCTVMFDRAGEPERGVVVARTDAGGRLMLGVPRDHADVLAQLLRTDIEIVGRRGTVGPDAGGAPRWSF
jgi:acetyl-CoA C-acetyltransferase